MLIRTEKSNPDQHLVYWTANVFLRNDPNPGYTNNLPQYLGLLNAFETDEWLQGRQTGKADDQIRKMVWEIIEENEAGIAYSADFTEESVYSFRRRTSTWMKTAVQSSFFSLPTCMTQSRKMRI